jgi:CHAD domain-containing protein
VNAKAGADGSIGELVHAYAAAQCAVILDTWDALGERDPAVVHPARVAVRRLRATLRTFHRVYDTRAGEQFAAELRWWGLILGGVRDVQVLTERFVVEDDPRTARGRAELFVTAQLALVLDAAWQATADASATDRAAELRSAVARWRDDPPFTEDARRAARRARKPVRKAAAKVATRIERVRAAPSGDPAIADMLHSARKAAKRHRYALELAAPVLGSASEDEIERRRELQDALGEHQDAVVADEFLSRLSVAGQPAEVAFALGELAETTRQQAQDVTGPLEALPE